MLPTPMSDLAADRGPMRALAIGLVVLWAATAVAVAAAYRPGGPLDLIVIIVSCGPVLVALAGVVWPPLAARHRHRVAVVWLWLAAVLFGIPVVYGVASTLTSGGPQNLVPSAEAAYAAVLAFFSMALFSVTGFVHRQRRETVFERRAAVLAALLAGLLTTAMAAQFVLVALINEGDAAGDGHAALTLRADGCRPRAALLRRAGRPRPERPRLDRGDLEPRRRGARLSPADRAAPWPRRGLERLLERARRKRRGELPASRAAGLARRRERREPAAASGGWQESAPDPFGLSGGDELTMDGPPHALVDVPRGSIVAEDLGIEVIEGAPARHCRTFVDGPTALATFLPLRWLLDDGLGRGATDVGRWRGEMDWWVFGDGELGRARVEVSGSRADTGWQASGVQAALEAELEAVDRDLPASISVPSDSPATALQSAAP